MPRAISVEVVLAMIEDRQHRLGIESIRHRPKNEDAYINHGMWAGMEEIKSMIMNKIKEEDEQNEAKRNGVGKHRSVY